MLNKIILAIFLFIFNSPVEAQKNQSFIGMFEYEISARDTSQQEMLSTFPMLVYTNDTITRTENFTNQLGVQVAIHHMVLNKSFLLLETAQGKFAIKTDLNKKKIDTVLSKYTFKKKWFKRKIMGIKANRIIASHPNFEEPIEFLYLKKVSSKYNDVFDEVPGLLVRYSIATADGVLNYEMIRMNEYSPNRGLFGIPSDFNKVSFDEFIVIVTSQNNQKVIEGGE